LPKVAELAGRYGALLTGVADKSKLLRVGAAVVGVAETRSTVKQTCLHDAARSAHLIPGTTSANLTTLPRVNRCEYQESS
jgi:hypothetical protein